jgi:hypothetical protein
MWLTVVMQANATQEEAVSNYAWIITKDHLDEGNGDAGISGPSDASDEMLASLEAGKGHTFYLYDDDGERYYTGRLVADEMDEEACYAPLGDFGAGWAGCTEVRWHGHSEWDCG